MHWNKEKIPVEKFLGRVHKIEESKYNAKNGYLASQAKDLEKFFNEVKEAFQNEGKIFDNGENLLDQQAMDLLIESIHQFDSRLKKIFYVSGSAGGFRFERDLSKVIAGVMNSVAKKNEKIDMGTIKVGTTSGSAAVAIGQLTKQQEQILEEIGTETYKIITDKKGNIIKKYYLPAVTGKADVQGYKININVKANAQLQYIYSLLKDAIFSAKNYSSISFKTGKDLSEGDIQLGNSNLYRAITNSLFNISTIMNINNATIKSAFYAGYNDIKNGNDNTKQHFYHLKFIYELTGGGIKYNGKDLKEVNFLIFNDPAAGGKVYVKSVPELLADVLDGMHPFSGDILSGIKISKKKFYK